MPWWTRSQAAKPAADNDDLLSEDAVELPPAAGKQADAAPPDKERTATAADTHPVLITARAAKIETAAQMSALVAEASDGRAYRTELRTYLQAQAIRLFGQEKGPTRAAAYAHLPLAEQRSVADAWADEADEKNGITQTEGAARQSAPAPPPKFAQPAEVVPAKEKQKAEEASTLAQTALGRRALAARQKSGA